MKGMVHISEPIITVMVEALMMAEGRSGQSAFARRQFRGCPAEIWPSEWSLLGRLVSVLKEPGAVEWLEGHLRQTLTVEISRTLRFMEYTEFLGTKYWWIVKGLLIAKRGDKCEECQAGGVLDAHHLTYEHRGSEVFHLDDLRLICRGCHDGHHGEL